MFAVHSPTLGHFCDPRYFAGCDFPIFCFLGFIQVLKIARQLKCPPLETEAISAQGLSEQLLMSLESFTFQAKISHPRWVFFYYI